VFSLLKRRNADGEDAMTARDCRRKFYEKRGPANFLERIGLMLRQLPPLRAKELPDVLAEKLLRLEQLDGGKTQDDGHMMHADKLVKRSSAEQ
jgi:hypothetical protein